MALIENTNSDVNWINLSGEQVTIVCEGFDTVVLAPNARTRHLPIRTTNNFALEMTFIREGGIESNCRIRWRTVADSYAIAQTEGDNPERAVKLVSNQTSSYAITLRSLDNSGGILIVGTIDTK